MTRDEIINIAKGFLLTEPIMFSQQWEDKLVDRLWNIREKNISIWVSKIHFDMQMELFPICKAWLLSRFPNANADDIVQDAWINWRKSNFDGRKSVKSVDPERSAMIRFTGFANIDAHRVEAGIEKVPYYETGYDNPDEEDEENMGSEPYLPDEAEVKPHSEGMEDEDETEEIFYEDAPDESSTGEVINQLPSETESHEEKSKTNTLYLNDKRFAKIAVNEVKTFFEFAKRKMQVQRYHPHRANQLFKPVRKTIEDETRAEFRHLNNTTIYYKERFNFLKNGEQRKWMEVAIVEMKKSRAELEKHILKLKEADLNMDEQEYRRQKPILSAVALDKDGKKVATCFKGEINHVEGERDLTFDLHCEYALFKHVVKDDNIHLLKDGTLYVTLEPCNKRGYYLDGEKERAKVPCAVRCIESGAKMVYIGSLDDNKQVFKKGETILRTGKYIFELQNGLHTGSQKEQRASELLEEYFRDEKKYPSEKFDDKIIYTIGEPVNPKYFDSDLMEEVRTINSYFLQRHNPTGFK